MKKIAVLGGGMAIGHFGGEFLGAMLGLTATSGFDAMDVLQIALGAIATLMLMAYL